MSDKEKIKVMLSLKIGVGDNDNFQNTTDIWKGASVTLLDGSINMLDSKKAIDLYLDETVKALKHTITPEVIQEAIKARKNAKTRTSTDANV